MARPNVQLGKDVSFTIAAVTDNGSGTLTPGAAAAMTGKAKSANLRLMRETERIEALDATRMNHVSILDGFSVTLNGITWKTVDGNPLLTKFIAGALAQIVCTTPDKTFTFLGNLEEFTMDLERGENPHSVTLTPIDNGAANPVIA